jgi:phosphatidylglycerophosphatase A
MKRVALIIATWFGCGYVPWGPGTAGSLAAVGIAAALHAFAGIGRLRLLALVLLLLPVAVWASTQAARILQCEDPGQVVIDEVLGQWLTLVGAAAVNWKSLAIGFVLFRIFDIWKPWPVREFEKLPGGAGIVADDLAAGVYGALILYIGGRLRLY